MTQMQHVLRHDIKHPLYSTSPILICLCCMVCPCQVDVSKYLSSAYCIFTDTIRQRLLVELVCEMAQSNIESCSGYRIAQVTLSLSNTC